MTRLITIFVLFVVVVVNSGGADVVGNSTQDEERSAKVVLTGAVKKNSDVSERVLSSVAPAALPSSVPKVQVNNNVGKVSGNKDENSNLVSSSPESNDQKPGVVDTVVSKAQSMFTSLASILHLGKNANISSKDNATVSQNASSPAVSATDKSKPLVIPPAYSFIPLTQKNGSSPISNATVLHSDPKKGSSKIAPSAVVFSANDTQEKPVPSAPSLVVSNETLSAIAPIAKTQLIASNASDIVPVKKVIIGSKGEILTHLAPKVSPTKKSVIEKQSTANSNVLPDAVSAETNSTNSNDPQAKQ